MHKLLQIIFFGKDMTNIFTLDNSGNYPEKINIDELYDNKQQRDIKQLELFKKILNRVHVRIKMIAKQNNADKCCWYVVPEIIIGVPKFDQGACIAYILTTLQGNGFQVKQKTENEELKLRIEKLEKQFAEMK